MKIGRGIYSVAIVLTAAGCASAPQAPSFRGCNLEDECVILQVENSQLSDAVIYLSGGRFGFAPGLEHTTFAIPRYRLDGNRCMAIRVRLIAGESYYSGKECVTVGGHYELMISPLLSTSSLTPFTTDR